MRRSEKEIKDRKDIDALIKSAHVMRLALTDGEAPYLVPVNFGYDGTHLFFHSAPVGKKIEMIKKNNTVCFEFEGETRVIPSEKPCGFSFAYKSVIGYGRAFILHDEKEKKAAMDVLMSTYAEGPFTYDENALKKTCMIKIEIDAVTGKKSPKRE